MEVEKLWYGPGLPSAFAFAAALIRYGTVAFSALYDPKTSMSITDLNAFSLRCLIGARKLPAAPALPRSQL
jgi:hypothetical protein